MDGRGMARGAWQPVGRWRTEALWRFFGLVVFQVDLMAAAELTTLSAYRALPGSYFAQLAGGLLLLLCGPRPALLLFASGSMLFYLVDYVLRYPDPQLAEEYTVLIALPAAGFALAAIARARGDSEEVIDRVTVALFRWTAVVVMGFAAFHKFNADFFDPAVSCASELLRWFRLVLPGFSALPEGGLVWRLVPVAAFLGEALIPLLLLTFPRLGMAWTLLVMGTIGHGNTTGFTSLVVLLATSFLRHEDGPVLARAVLRRWPLFATGVLVLAFFSTRVYSGIRWFEYHLFEGILLALAIALCELVLADARRHRGERGAWLRSLLRPRVDVAGLLPRPGIYRAALVGLALLGAANALTPYFGPKFRMSFAMFSNLRADAHRWNHYLVPRALAPRAPGRFLELVRVDPPGSWYFEGKPVEPGLYSPTGFARRLEALASEPRRVAVVLRVDGRVRTFHRASRNPELGALLRGMPRSKLLQEHLTVADPQFCTH